MMEEILMVESEKMPVRKVFPIPLFDPIQNEF